MPKTIALITHHTSDGPDLNNRAYQVLHARGFDLQWVHTPAGEPLPEPDEAHVGAIVFGGAQDITEIDRHPFLKAEIDWVGHWSESGKPFLGICLGAQMLAHALGAPITRHPEDVSEIGFYPVRPTEADPDFIADPFHVYHWHREGVFDLPQSCTQLAMGETFPNQAFRYNGNAFGLQFHPEVTPPIMHRWMGEASHMLENPGAHDRATQIDQSARFDTPMGLWFESFLSRLFDT